MDPPDDGQQGIVPPAGFMMRAIDLFAGWGGFTLGALQAGLNVVWAANHWTLAVEAHAINHPETLHVCQDLQQADWSLLPDYEILLASPACQGHSSAGRPRRPGVRRKHDDLRATAYAVLSCAEITQPEIVIVENVSDFRSWGPVDDPGALYQHWLRGLEILGYHTQEQFLTASKLGVPQRRKRLFVVATREPMEISLEFSEEPAFGPCIEWDAPGWRSVAGASEAVQKRIRKGRRNHGDRFVSQHVTGHPGISLDEPIRTITAQDQFVLVDGDQYRPLTIRETARGMGFPDSYRWPARSTRRDAIRGLGNAVCPPVAKALIEAL